MPKKINQKSETNSNTKKNVLNALFLKAKSNLKLAKNKKSQSNKLVSEDGIQLNSSLTQEAKSKHKSLNAEIKKSSNEKKDIDSDTITKLLSEAYDLQIQIENTEQKMLSDIKVSLSLAEQNNEYISNLAVSNEQIKLAKLLTKKEPSVSNGMKTLKDLQFSLNQKISDIYIAKELQIENIKKDYVAKNSETDLKIVEKKTKNLLNSNKLILLTQNIKNTLDTTIESFGKIDANNLNASNSEIKQLKTDLKNKENYFSKIIKECSKKLGISHIDVPESYNSYLAQEKEIVDAAAKLNITSSNPKLNDLVKKYKEAYREYFNASAKFSASALSPQVDIYKYLENKNKQDTNLHNKAFISELYQFESENTQESLERELSQRIAESESRESNFGLKSKINSMISKYELLKQKQSTLSLAIEKLPIKPINKKSNKKLNLNLAIEKLITKSINKKSPHDIIKESANDFSQTYSELINDIEKNFSPEDLSEYDPNEFQQLHLSNEALKLAQKNLKDTAHILQSLKSFQMDKKGKLLTDSIDTVIFESIGNLYNNDMSNCIGNNINILIDLSDSIDSDGNFLSFRDTKGLKNIEYLKSQQQDIQSLQNIADLQHQIANNESEILSIMRNSNESTKKANTKNNPSSRKNIILQGKEISSKCIDIQKLYIEIQEKSKEAMSHLHENSRLKEKSIDLNHDIKEEQVSQQDHWNFRRMREFSKINYIANESCTNINMITKEYFSQVNSAEQSLKHMENILKKTMKACSDKLKISITDVPKTYDDYISQKEVITYAIKKMKDESVEKKHNTNPKMQNKNEEFTVTKANNLLKEYKIAYHNYIDPKLIKPVLKLQSKIFKDLSAKNNSKKLVMSFAETHNIPNTGETTLKTELPSLLNVSKKSQSEIKKQYKETLKAENKKNNTSKKESSLIPKSSFLAKITKSSNNNTNKSR